MTDNTIPYSAMKERVGQKEISHGPSQWVNPPSVKLEDELFDRKKKERISGEFVSLSG
mgnify:CR=1 FL=1